MEHQSYGRAEKPLSVYAEELRQWLSLMHLHRSASLMNSALLMQSASDPRLYSRDGNSNLRHAIFTQPQSDQPPQATTPPRVPANEGDQHPMQNFPQNAGTECRIPSLWKRFFAECIDFFILLSVKLIISFILVHLMGFKAIQILDFDYAFLNGELDLDKLVSLSGDIFTVEMIHRIFITLYEALCLAYVTAGIGGATPGKRIMGICVVSCEDVYTIGHGRLVVIDLQSVSLSRALVRSFLKNFSHTFMLPTCFTVYMFEHRRALHDFFSSTVVIELQ